MNNIEANREVNETNINPLKVRCINDRGEVGYFNADTVRSKSWQRSTGFRPAPKPEPIYTSPPIAPATHEPEIVAESVVMAQGAAAPVKKRGRKPQNT